MNSTNHTTAFYAHRRKTILPGLTLVLFGLLFGSVTGRADTDIERIRDHYAACTALRNDNIGRRQFFGVYTDLENQTRPNWTGVRPDNALVPEQAELFGPQKTTRFAILTINSPSGDWSQYTEHCFREDGSLAFVYAELQTSYGNVRLEDRLYFDRVGAQIRSIRRIYDLDSGKRLPDDTDNFTDRATRLYLRSKTLDDELTAK